MKVYAKIICIVLAVIILVGTVIFVLPVWNIGFPDFSSLFNNNKQEEVLYELKVSATEGGSVNSEGGTYAPGSLIDIIATPNEGYVFSYWADENGKCLTSYNAYSLEIKQDTYLVAHFIETPKDLVASNDQGDVLMDCADNFSFVVECDREDALEYLQNNLSVVNDMFVGTEYEEVSKAKFTVLSLGDNKYQVSPAEGQPYEKGLTYTAVLPAENEDAQFVQNGATGNSMSFSIQCDEADNVAKYVSGIVLLVESENAYLDNIIAMVDDGLTEKDENDIEDYLILNELFGISENSIICIHNGEAAVGENEMPPMENVVLYAKVKTVTLIEQGEYSGYYKVVYVQPELQEIFTELNVAHKDTVDFEKSDIEIKEETIEEIKYSILSNEEFQNLVCVAQATFTKEVEAQGYELQQISMENLIDMVDIKFSYQKKGDKFIINISVSLNFSINNKHTHKQVAQLSLSMDVVEEYSVDVGGQISLRWWWFIPTGVNYIDIYTTNKRNSTTTLAVSITYDKGSDGISDFDKNFNEEKMKADIVKAFSDSKASSWRDSQNIKDIFKANGYNTNGNRRYINLFETHWYFGGVFSANLELTFFFEFDLEGSLFYSTNTYTKKTDGIRYSGGKFKPYSNVNESVIVKSGHMLVGTVGVKTGLKLDIYVSFVGLSKYIKAGIYGELGLYASATGFISTETGHHAGKLEAGMYYKVSLYAKLFSLYGEYALVSGEHPLISYGYSEAYLYYPKIDDPNNIDIVLSQRETYLFSQDLFLVAALDIGDSAINTDKLNPKSNQYTIKLSFADGKYLTYDNVKGIVKIKGDAPTYFSDTITIEVCSNNGNKWSALKDGSICIYLPKLTINVTYGNIDDYYESLDTDIQRYFRDIYKNYNSANAKILKSNFADFAIQGTEVKGKYSDAYNCILENYIDVLFSTIETNKIQDQENGNRNLEHEFIAKEPEAFKTIFILMNSLLSDSDAITERTVIDVLSRLLESPTMYDAILMSVGYERVESLSSVFEGGSNPEKKIVMIDALNKFDETHKNNPRAITITAAIRKLFAL